MNGVPPLAPVPLGGTTEQKSSFSMKKPGCSKHERNVRETDGKGLSGGSEGKVSDMCTGSEGSSVLDCVTSMNSVHDTRSMKDASLVLLLCSDTYIYSPTLTASFCRKRLSSRK